MLQNNISNEEFLQIGCYLNDLGKLLFPILTLVNGRNVRRFLLDAYESSEAATATDLIPGLSAYFKSLGQNYSSRISSSDSTIGKELIISITSYPARIKTSVETIKSVLNQSLPNNTKVILYLSKEEFQDDRTLPCELRAMLSDKRFLIKYVEGNIRSYKKLIPALQDYPENPILTIDDDIVYPENFVRNLYEAYLVEPDQIHCNRARQVRFLKNGLFDHYSNWRLRIQQKPLTASFDSLFTGVGGVLYPPHSLYELVDDKKMFLKLCPNSDDIWFWCMAVLNGTKIHRIDQFISDFKQIDGTQETSLWRSNENGGNDKALSNLIEEFPFLKDRCDFPCIQAKNNNRRSITCLKRILKSSLIRLGIFDQVQSVRFWLKKK